MEPIKTPPTSGVMIISVRRRVESEGDLVIRIRTAIDDQEFDPEITTRDDEALAAVERFLARMGQSGPR